MSDSTAQELLMQQFFMKLYNVKLSQIMVMKHSQLFSLWYSMSQLQHKLSNLQQRCQQLEQKISSSSVEVRSLKDAHQDLMRDNAQLRASVSATVPFLVCVCVNSNFSINN